MIILVRLRYLFLAFSAVPVLTLAQTPDSGNRLATGSDAPNPVLPAVVVSATRHEQSSFELPVSINQVDRKALQEQQLMVNLSESLVRVPGLVIQNRHNYAQDLQISSRGFGARSTFGVRGIRLYSDGIPATMPDGQGQVSHFDLGSADRIEVMRGPFSALYGNSSGGVIALFTENGKPGVALQGDAQIGSHNTQRYGLKSSGEQGQLNHVVSVSRFSTDGFREHSAATRTTENAKLRLTLDDDAQLTLVGNAVQMHDVDDPLGLTRMEFNGNPYATTANAVNFNTRKSVDQHQLGLVYQRNIDHANSLHAMVYAGQRKTIQFQSIPPGAQAAPTQSGGVIDLERRYWGTDLRWTQRASLAGKPFQWTAGANVDQLDEERRGYENFIGPTLGVAGRLRRNEDNRISSFDQYVQAQWEPTARWLLMAGARHSEVKMRSTDRYVTAGNGDDSGKVSFDATSPVLGATFRLREGVNLYGALGKGFETPTFNEISYRSTTGSVTGLNFALNPAVSRHAEIGIKAHIGKHALVDAAVFHAATRDELTVLASSGGRAVYQNAGKTKRDGFELRTEGSWGNGVAAQLAYSYLRAVYAQPFCSGACSAATQVPAGNQLPGVPRHHLHGEVSWRHAPAGFSTALEARYTGKVYVDDANSDAAAGYTLFSVRAGFEQAAGSWRLRQFMRIDNLADRVYAGSVIVNESNRRYFEPAPGRTYLVGVSAAYSW